MSVPRDENVVATPIGAAVVSFRGVSALMSGWPT